MLYLLILAHEKNKKKIRLFKKRETSNPSRSKGKNLIIKLSILLIVILFTFTKSFGQTNYSIKDSAKSNIVIPDPIATLGTGMYEGGNIEKNKLLAQYGIIPILKHFAYDASFSVKSFDFEYSLNSINHKLSNSSSEQLTPEMIDVIKTLPSGTKISFSNIKAKCREDGTIRSLKSINFIVL
jgi:hypothetical protein